ncbi:hypothetical protein GCK72_006999 [Caenorhabditis remanei]|uniref:Uncharacterized protein n=1 Tax=Caenorhabditis remanei TaxID=31234 RepID=A0A6A5HIT4_CAERE|nr:hypothetical protein GCK72_006999 [Caenorhabditis remanei]KAF1767041.1 hypothetical protein GCK72_006999 [Caenorhabditis remanei]
MIEELKENEIRITKKLREEERMTRKLQSGIDVFVELGSLLARDQEEMKSSHQREIEEKVLEIIDLDAKLVEERGAFLQITKQLEEEKMLQANKLVDMEERLKGKRETLAKVENFIRNKLAEEEGGSGENAFFSPAMFSIETLMNEGNTQATPSPTNSTPIGTPTPVMLSPRDFAFDPSALNNAYITALNSLIGNKADQPSTSTAPPPVPFNYSPPALTAPLLKALLTKAASNGPSSNGHPLPGAAQNRGPSSSSSSSSSSSPSHSVAPISTQTPSPSRSRPSPSVQTLVISGPAAGKYAHPHDGSGSSTPFCSASTSAPTQADLSLVRKFMRKTSGRVQPVQNGVNHVAPRVTPPARPIQVIDIDAPGPSSVRAPAQNSMPSTSNGGNIVSNNISSVVAVLSKLPSAKLSTIRPTPTASSASIEEAKLFKLFMNTVFGLLKSKTFLSNSLEIQLNLCDILMKFDRLSDDGREMVRPHLCSELCQLIFSLTLLVRDLTADLSRRPSPSASTSIAVQTDPEIIVTETTEPLDLTVSRTSPSDQQEDQEFHAEKSVDQEIDRMWADLEAQIRSKYKRKLVDVHDCYIDEVEKKGVVVGHLIEKRNFKRKRTMSEPSNFSTKKQRRD